MRGQGQGLRGQGLDLRANAKGKAEDMTSEAKAKTNKFEADTFSRCMCTYEEMHAKTCSKHVPSRFLILYGTCTMRCLLNHTDCRV